MTHDHDHDHDHEHGHDDTDETADDVRPRVRAIQSLLTEAGVVSTDAIDEAISAYEEEIGPLNGARVVARAWTDPEFEARLLDDANEAIREFDFDIGVQQIEVKANTPSTHNAVVCTLCSCYPWSLLGLPPTWYKTPAYRSRMVREPRSVLSEFGTELDDDVDVEVWDSSSEIRYMVLPRQPPGTDDLGEDELVDLVTRDAMIGVSRLDAAAADGGRPASRNSETRSVLSDLLGEDDPVFSAPWQARTFGIAVALRDGGNAVDWPDFQARLIDAVEATSPEAYEGDDPGERARETYYEQWSAALERLLVDEGLLDPAAIHDRAAEFAAGDRTAEEFVQGDRGH
jgi:nitrile hydratase alpha subunit/nitrile hydratase accessory protein